MAITNFCVQYIQKFWKIILKNVSHRYKSCHCICQKIQTLSSPKFGLIVNGRNDFKLKRF